MAYLLRWRPALAAGAFCLAAAAPGGAFGADPVEVNFRSPEHYTDIGQDPKLESAWMDDLRTHLQQRAARVLPPGDRLLVTVTDVARAGVVRHLPARDLRVVRDNGAQARIDLDFQWLSPRGEVLGAGSRHLQDGGDRFHTAAERYGPAAIENRLIDTWLQGEFGAR